ncbi:MAG: outer membrane beta-barrel protein [Polyangiaceae bacterium]
MKQAVSTRALAVLAGASVLFSAHVASALLPLDVEIGAKVGGGTTPSNVASGATNPLGFGLGGRAGVAFLGLYGGVSIAYYFGGSETLPIVGAVVPAVSSSTHSLMYGFEAGYGTVLVNVLTLRAQVGIGNFTNTLEVGSVSTDSSNLYLEPGITALVSLPFGGLFVGADANVLLLPGVKDATGQSQTVTAFTFHGQIGYKF